jgi:hypothetical protein
MHDEGFQMPKRILTWNQRIAVVLWSRMPERWRLSHELRRTDRFYDRLIQAAERGEKIDERDSLISELMDARGRSQDRLDWLETRYWVRKARHYHVPVPPRESALFDPNWEECRHLGPGYRTLSDAGISIIRKGIREEKRWHREGFIGYTSALIGLLGTLIGVISALAHYSK